MNNLNAEPDSDSFPVIAIGTSAGGLKALQTLLGALPADFPAAILIVQHISPSYRSQLASILARYTDLGVKEAEVGDRPLPGKVYIAPPAYHLVVKPNQTLDLSLSPRVHFSRPSVDVLLESVATVYQDRAIAVILTGHDADGSDAIKLIKDQGGMVIAQDLDTAQALGMPRAAISTGIVDFVLPLPEIALTLIQVVNSLKTS